MLGLGALAIAAMVALTCGTNDRPPLLSSAMIGMSHSVCAALLWPAVVCAAYWRCRSANLMDRCDSMSTW